MLNSNEVLLKLKYIGANAKWLKTVSKKDDEKMIFE